MMKNFFLLFLLICLLGCIEEDIRYFIQETNLQFKDVEHHTFSMYENNVFIEKWKFESDVIITPSTSILYTIQGNVFILGNNYLKNNYSYKATNSKKIVNSIEFTKILLPQDSVKHNFKLIKR